MKFLNGPADDLRLRWERLQAAMRTEGAEACLVSTSVNLYYLTGRIYGGYFYLPAAGRPRFFIKRPQGLEEEGLTYIRKPEEINGLLAAEGLPLPKKLLLEADEISYTDYCRLSAAFPSCESGNASTLLRRLRMCKTPWEIEQFRISARQHAKTYAEVPACFRPGMSDLQFQAEIERRMRLNGSLGTFRAYGPMDIFMGSVLTGGNAEAPSPFDFALGGAGADLSLPIGANGTPLREGCSVMVDMAGNYTAYMTDMTRTFSVGKLPEAAYRAHELARRIEREIAQMLRPGLSTVEPYRLALRLAEEGGLAANFMGTRQQAKFVGHGIGLQINEPPVLAARPESLLEAGMLIAVEPKFVLPGIGAVGIEDSFLLTSDGAEQITFSEPSIVDLTK
ncbi:MAG: Xaa-Pro peptidase family protein [Tannerella sp.]|nr:Xaa-Pro peptidase family protein [Tannerella sp.]